MRRKLKTHIATIQKLLSEGKGAIEIAKELNFAEASVYGFLSLSGMKVLSISELYGQKIENLYAKNKSCYTIAKSLGVSKSSVYCHLKRKGLIRTQS